MLWQRACHPASLALCRALPAAWKHNLAGSSSQKVVSTTAMRSSNAAAPVGSALAGMQQQMFMPSAGLGVAGKLASSAAHSSNAAATLRVHPDDSMQLSSRSGDSKRQHTSRWRRRLAADDDGREAAVGETDCRTATAAAGARQREESAAGALQAPRRRRRRIAAADTAAAGVQLLDLGELVVGEVIKRPSAAVRTPYVADVRLLQPGGAAVLAHTPALDGGGMIVPGARVRMTTSAVKQGQKTTHAVQIAEDLREGGRVALVGAHPFLAERLAEAAVQRRLLPLPAELQRYSSVLKQQTEGSGRFDFVLCYDDGSRLLLEVKNVVAADFPEGAVPAQRSKVGVYTVAAEPHTRSAIFPIGSAGNAKKKGVKGVVSDRAIKHLHELTQLQQAGADSQGRPVSCAILFVVNRSDCGAFRPCHEADMMFARMLLRAQQQGVLVMAHDVHWQGGRALWGKALPVVYAPAVAAAGVDEEQLAAVLQFNQTNPGTHWKKQKKAGAS
ncbi:hypothetical protein COO60DRAFT_802466 [Scenedesmus sp. NREL 46B-D3]|nr:hypothetical protein COO60DRAFT_802466 [Scenedesmus sp. NREL 46B-D3]